MEIRTLQGVPLAILANTFNEAFSDYRIKFSVSEEIFRKKFEAEAIKQELSAGVFDGDRLVGFIIHGVDVIDGTGYVFNAGTGVVPSHRGLGLTGQMYSYILPVLKQHGYTHHQLEVLQDNAKAIKAYENMGFRPVRQLACFTGKVEARPNANSTITQIKEPDWNMLHSFRNVQPTWQNNTQSIIRALPRHDFYEARIGVELAGYAAVDTFNLRLKQFAVNPDFRRRGVGTALFAFVSGKYGQVNTVNFDLSDTGSITFFKKLGLQQDFEMHEMTLHY
jgi:ribosomal protein S18 acetylase RimI-like enzyme